MQTIFTVIQVFLSLGLIGLILIQHGKGADAGAAFGSGASATVFGARGSGSFLTRTTAIMATLFFLSSMALAYYATQGAEPVTVMDEVDEQALTVPPPTAPPSSDIPAIPAAGAPPTVAPPTDVPAPPPATAAEGEGAAVEAGPVDAGREGVSEVAAPEASLDGGAAEGDARPSGPEGEGEGERTE